MEARAEPLRHLDDLLLPHAERRGERLAREVVRRAAEAAGHEEDVAAGRVLADERRHGLDLVRQRCEEPNPDAELLEPLREP